MSIAFIETAEGRRKILPHLTPSQFAIGRISMPETVKNAVYKKTRENPSHHFQIGEHFFLLLTGYNLSSGFVDLSIDRAKRTSAAHNVEDDLDQTGFLRPGNPHYDPFRLGHAFEHEVVCRILENGTNLISPAQYPGLRMAEARIWRPTSSSPVRQFNIGFHLNAAFAAEETVLETIHEVSRAFNQFPPIQLQKSA